VRKPGERERVAVSGAIPRHQSSEVGFAGTSPGRIQAFNLKDGQSMLVAREGFLCAQTTALWTSRRSRSLVGTGCR